MKILILRAAGQISRLLTKDLLEQTDYDLVLYARNASMRLKNAESKRVLIADGDFTNYDALRHEYSVLNNVGHMVPIEFTNGTREYPVQFWADAFKKP